MNFPYFLENNLEIYGWRVFVLTHFCLFITLSSFLVGFSAFTLKMTRLTRDVITQPSGTWSFLSHWENSLRGWFMRCLCCVISLNLFTFDFEAHASKSKCSALRSTHSAQTNLKSMIELNGFMMIVEKVSFIHFMRSIILTTFYWNSIVLNMNGSFQLNMYSRENWINYSWRSISLSNHFHFIDLKMTLSI